MIISFIIIKIFQEGIEDDIWSVTRFIKNVT